MERKDMNERLFATFFVDQLEFALDVEYVQDAIAAPKEIVPLPAAPDCLSGIISLRDNIVPIVDIRKRFRMPVPPEPQDGHVAITRCKGRFMGLTFDRINEVIRVNRLQMETLMPEFQEEGDLLAHVIKLDEGRRLVQVINPLSMFDFKDLPLKLQQQATCRETTEADDQRRQVLCFYIGEELFGIDVAQVREIIMVPDITQRVLVEEYILGVISLRGEQLSIIDMRVFLGEETTALTPEHRVVILNDETLPVGVLVDGIKEVFSYPPNHLQPMPPLVGNRHKGGFSGIIEQPDTAVVLLDMDQLFNTARERISGHLRINDDNDAPEQNYALGQITARNPLERQQTYITFALDGVYGVPIEHAREIVPNAGNIHHLPGQVSYIEGFINLRTEVIPVINLRCYFQMADDRGDEELIMILTLKGRQMGILIDRLLEIVTLDHREETQVPKLLVRHEESRFRETLERVIEMKDRNGNSAPIMILDVARFMAAMTPSAESDHVEAETSFPVITDELPDSPPEPPVDA